TAMVVGIGLVLAAETTMVITTKLKKSHESSADAIYEKIWSNPNSDSIPELEKAPPALIIRPTRYPNSGGGVWTKKDGKGFWVNGNVNSLVGLAYTWSPVRTVFPDSLPKGNYDVMESLPDGQNAAAFKAEIQKQFGLVAHTEICDTEVFALKIRDTRKLQARTSIGGRSTAYMTGDNKVQNFFFKNESLKDLANSLEGRFERPLVDQTDSVGRYDFEFQWSSRLTGTKRVAESLREQLDRFGLELVPSREPIEMLIVEKVK
ncbi:MAG: TIGR03435 family protein, partial [Verrucomicrobiota bacterium]